MATGLSSASKEAIANITNSDCQGYDQYGAMLGEVFIKGEDKEQFQINLPGLRQRRWDSKDSGVQRSSSVIGVMADGLVFNVGALSSKGIKQYVGTFLNYRLLLS